MDGAYDWPGNVRELKNTIEGAFNIETSDLITLDSVQNLLSKMEQNTKPVPEIPPVQTEVRELALWTGFGNSWAGARWT